jgi:hypothetical protein
MGGKMRAAAILWNDISVGFKADCLVYARAYNNQHLGEKKLNLDGYNIYIMGMLKHFTIITSITTIKNSLGSTIQEWINGGYLKRISTDYKFEATVD